MRPLLALPLIAGVLGAGSARADDPPKVFELRTYHAHPGKLGALDARFRDHTHAMFQKHGMTPVGYWTPTDEASGAGKTFIYLLAFPSREAASASWAAFRDDPDWKAAKAASEADGPLVEKVESLFLEPTDYSPDALKTTTAPADGPARTYELRTYHTSPGKLPDLNTRFRDHTMDLFAKHGMTNIAYFTPADEDQGRDGTLVYLLAFPSRDAARASWKAFGDDPDWQKVYKESQSDGVPLAAKVNSVFLAPTEYSPAK